MFGNAQRPLTLVATHLVVVFMRMPKVVVYRPLVRRGVVLPAKWLR